MKYQCSEFERIVASLFLSFFYKNNTNPDTKKTTEEAIKMYNDSFANGEMKTYPKLAGRIRAEVATEAALLDMVKELDSTCNPADMKQLKEMTKDPNRYAFILDKTGLNGYKGIVGIDLKNFEDIKKMARIKIGTNLVTLAYFKWHEDLLDNGFDRNNVLFRLIKEEADHKGIPWEFYDNPDNCHLLEIYSEKNGFFADCTESLPRKYSDAELEAPHEYRRDDGSHVFCGGVGFESDESPKPFKEFLDAFDEIKRKKEAKTLAGTGFVGYRDLCDTYADLLKYVHENFPKSDWENVECVDEDLYIVHNQEHFLKSLTTKDIHKFIKAYLARQLDNRLDGCIVDNTRHLSGETKDDNAYRILFVRNGEKKGFFTIKRDDFEKLIHDTDGGFTKENIEKFLDKYRGEKTDYGWHEPVVKIGREEVVVGRGMSNAEREELQDLADEFNSLAMNNSLCSTVYVLDEKGIDALLNRLDYGSAEMWNEDKVKSGDLLCRILEGEWMQETLGDSHDFIYLRPYNKDGGRYFGRICVSSKEKLRQMIDEELTDKKKLEEALAKETVIGTTAVSMHKSVKSMHFPQVCHMWERLVKYVHDNFDKALWKDVECMDENLFIMYDLVGWLNEKDDDEIYSMIEEVLAGKVDLRDYESPDEDSTEYTSRDVYEYYKHGKYDEDLEERMDKITFFRDGERKSIFLIDKDDLKELLSEVIETSEGVFDRKSVLDFLNKYRGEKTEFGWKGSKADGGDIIVGRKMTDEEREELQKIANKRNKLVLEEESDNHRCCSSGFVLDENGIKNLFEHLDGAGSDEPYNCYNNWTSRKLLVCLLTRFWSFFNHGNDFVYISCEDEECEGDIWSVSKEEFLDEIKEGKAL